LRLSISLKISKFDLPYINVISVACVVEHISKCIINQNSITPSYRKFENYKIVLVNRNTLWWIKNNTWGIYNDNVIKVTFSNVLFCGEKSFRKKIYMRTSKHSRK
jgi:hypothetical protein